MSCGSENYGSIASVHITEHPLLTELIISLLTMFPQVSFSTVFPMASKMTGKSAGSHTPVKHRSCEITNVMVSLLEGYPLTSGRDAATSIPALSAVSCGKTRRGRLLIYLLHPQASPPQWRLSTHPQRLTRHLAHQDPRRLHRPPCSCSSVSSSSSRAALKIRPRPAFPLSLSWTMVSGLAASSWPSSPPTGSVLWARPWSSSFSAALSSLLPRHRCRRHPWPVSSWCLPPWQAP